MEEIHLGMMCGYDMVLKDVPSDKVEVIKKIVGNHLEKMNLAYLSRIEETTEEELTVLVKTMTKQRRGTLECWLWGHKFSSPLGWYQYDYCVRCGTSLIA